jgi:butyrate kinase
VEYEKAFDRVSRESIWHALEQKAILPKLVAMIKAQYDGFKYRVM